MSSVNLYFGHVGHRLTIIYLFSQNISIAIVGKNEKFHILDDSEIAYYVAATEKRSPGPPPGPGDGGAGSVTPPSIDQEANKRDDKGPADPQVLVAMET